MHQWGACFCKSLLCSGTDTDDRPTHSVGFDGSVCYPVGVCFHWLFSPNMLNWRLSGCGMSKKRHTVIWRLCALFCVCWCSVNWLLVVKCMMNCIQLVYCWQILIKSIKFFCYKMSACMGLFTYLASRSSRLLLTVTFWCLMESNKPCSSCLWDPTASSCCTKLTYRWICKNMEQEKL